MPLKAPARMGASPDPRQKGRNQSRHLHTDELAQATNGLARLGDLPGHAREALAGGDGVALENSQSAIGGCEASSGPAWINADRELQIICEAHALLLLKRKNGPLCPMETGTIASSAAQHRFAGMRRAPTRRKTQRNLFS
jgi:hypothetical protein